MKDFVYRGPLCFWPPDHKWVVLRLERDFSAMVHDACGPNPRLYIAEAKSTQPADATGNGNTAPDSSFSPTAFASAASAAETKP